MPEPLREKHRIPEEIEGIQVNFCKNPSCANFGVPASQKKQPRGPGAANKERDTYIVGGSKNKVPQLKCELCGEYPTIKSNQAIYEESLRLSEYFVPRVVSCPNPECSNHSVSITTRKAYHSFGKTRSGSQRYRCKECKTTFAVGKSTLRQRKPHKNIQVFQLLMNKMPFKRICETADISMPTLYNKIDFLQRQCLSFAANRERKLLEGMPIKRLYLGVDRQDHTINWTDSADKRNVVLHALGSADNDTGYVFGLHLNFDPTIDPSEVREKAIDYGDYNLKAPFRRYARVWLPSDYMEAVHKGNYPSSHEGPLQKGIESAYREASDREDIEVSEGMDYDTSLPLKGMQVHAEYTLYGHFFFLRKLLKGVERVRFFLDQDSGMRAACLAAFVEEIKKGSCDAFYVRINKELTINEKRQALAESRKEWNSLKKSYPGNRDSELKLLMIKESIKRLEAFGKWNDKWVYHPFPNMSEPEKAVCYLTDMGKYDEDHLAWLYNKASLHAIDRFFMQVRRRISLLERPISSPSSGGRRWFGYSAYNPENVVKLLDIFRVFYNYIETGNDRQTPAMRLGLARNRISMENIIYY